MTITFHEGQKLVEAVSDPVRAFILRVLACGEYTAEALARRVPAAASETDGHIRVLCSAGLVSVREDFGTRFVSLAPGADAIIRNYLDNNRIPHDPAFCALVGT